MTLEEFDKKHCSICGTQRCMGIYDLMCRGACGVLQTVYPPNVKGITNTYASGECIATEIGFGHQFSDDLTIWFDGYEPIEDEFHLTTIFEL